MDLEGMAGTEADEGGIVFEWGIVVAVVAALAMRATETIFSLPTRLDSAFVFVVIHSLIDNR